MPTCFGAGLVALDVILNGSPSTLPKISAGGSCGNVLSILAYLGWHSFPIARLSDNCATKELLNDFSLWKIHTNHLYINDEGTTPIIIHRIMKDKQGHPIHRFEFQDPETKSWLPQFKPITKTVAAGVINSSIIPQIFYFDRMNPGTFDLAKSLKAKGAIIYFEPSNVKDAKQFYKFLEITDILKFSKDRLTNYRERHPTIQVSLEIETQGKDGIAYRFNKSESPNQWKVLKGYAINNIKDTAGAGDWCSAGFISKLVVDGQKGLTATTISEIEAALNYGQLLGAWNCLYDGARGLMYHFDAMELAKLISTNSEQLHNVLLSPIAVRNQPSINISKSIKISSLY